MYENSRLIIDSSNIPETGTITWRSPSNIAIIKYWGKYGTQLPRNPSLSFTLASSCTDTMLEYEFREELPDGNIDLEFLFHQEENEAFRVKMLEFLTSLLHWIRANTFTFVVLAFSGLLCIWMGCYLLCGKRKKIVRALIQTRFIH